MNVYTVNVGAEIELDCAVSRDEEGYYYLPLGKKVDGAGDHRRVYLVPGDSGLSVVSIGGGLSVMRTAFPIRMFNALDPHRIILETKREICYRLIERGHTDVFLGGNYRGLLPDRHNVTALVYVDTIQPVHIQGPHFATTGNLLAKGFERLEAGWRVQGLVMINPGETITVHADNQPYSHTIVYEQREGWRYPRLHSYTSEAFEARQDELRQEANVIAV